MSILKKTSDLTAAAIGYLFASPTDAALSPVNTLLSANLPVSQGVIDEIVKGFAGLAIAVVSRWVYGLFEKKKKVEPAPSMDKAALPPQPETLTLNNNTDGNKKEGQQVSSDQR